VLGHVELAVEARDAEDAADGSAGVDQAQPATLLPRAHVRTQDQAQAGGVHELEPAEVDQDLGPHLALGADELVVEPRSAVEVELAVQGEAEGLALLAALDREPERAHEVREEYEDAYRDLRRRLLAGWLLACAAVVAVGVLVLPLA